MLKFLFALFIIMIFPTQIFASELPKCFKKFNFSYLDYGFMYDMKKGTGIEKDLLDEIKKRTHCQFENVKMTRARMWISFAHGDLDIMLGGIKNPEREKVAYIFPYVKLKNMALIRKDANATSMEDFIANKNLRFGIVRSFKHGSQTLDDDFLKKLQAANRVEEFVDQEILFLYLKNNKIQGIFSSNIIYKKQFKEDKNLNDILKVVDWIPKEEPFHRGLMFSKLTFNQEEADKWQKLIKSVVQDKTIYKIFIKYLSKEDTNNMILQ
ncbi:substrate-binding periplasmic protein [Fluviispira vulneris]|uniref:substrate-binding periplasmic protein n=1 Tax=Fluviispira vulneris TaxID=2763012 RepID=UPI001645A165|nr:transporter substrate-binding domain-containing protein [Fluviispira vulneris]